MPSEPSVKGVAFQSVVADVSNLLARGEIAEETLARHLKPEDRVYLGETTVIPTLVYPIGTYARMLSLLCDIEGRGQRSYLVERGASAAERVLQAGIYARMMETAEKWGGEQVSRAIIGLATSFYNFMEWELVGSIDAPSLQIEVRDALAYPDEARYAAEGFLRVLFARHTDASVEVDSERPEPARVVFRIRHT